MDEQNPMLPTDVPTQTPAPAPAPMQAAPPVKPAPSKQWLWIALIAVVVLAGAAYGWMMLYPLSPVAEDTATPTAVANTESGIYAGWKTYTNTRNGFEVKYPSNFRCRTSVQGAQIVCSDITLGVVIEPSDAPLIDGHPYLDIDIKYTNFQATYAELIEKGQQDCDKLIFSEQVRFAGRDGYEITRASCVGERVISIVLPYDSSRAIVLSGTTNAKGMFSDEQLKILDTFKFTDPTADWKTYTNVQYGYSFKYPSDWVIVPNDANNMAETATQQVFLRSPQTVAGIASKTINPGYSFDLVVSYFKDGTVWAGDANPARIAYSGTTTIAGNIAVKDYIKGGQGQNYAAVIEQYFPHLWEFSFETAWDKTKLTDAQRNILSTFKFSK